MTRVGLGNMSISNDSLSFVLQLTDQNACCSAINLGKPWTLVK